MSPETNFLLPERSLVLDRTLQGVQSGLRSHSLRAWDAADEQLVHQVQSMPRGRLAIVDDAFGALSLGLIERSPTIIADSATLPVVLTHNAALNGLVSPTVSDWRLPPEGPFDQIVLKIPRQLDYLEYLLRWANDVLAPGGQAIAGGMIKHLPARCAARFQALMASNTPLPARRKARVILAEPGSAGVGDFGGLWRGYDLSEMANDLPVSNNGGFLLNALPAVFAREQPDIGTRVFLPPAQKAARELPERAQVLDLGCGNGAVGLAVLAIRPDLAVDFTDVSSQAVASAEANCAAFGFDAATRFLHQDGTPEGEKYDLILCNPPFHEGGTVGDHIALRLFQEAASALRPGGKLLIVGNRHLGYHHKLKRWFARVDQLADHPKFVVLAAHH